jgi:hypothetical protein
MLSCGPHGNLSSIYNNKTCTCESGYIPEPNFSLESPCTTSSIAKDAIFSTLIALDIAVLGFTVFLYLMKKSSNPILLLMTIITCGLAIGEHAWIMVQQRSHVGSQVLFWFGLIPLAKAWFYPISKENDMTVYVGTLVVQAITFVGVILSIVGYTTWSTGLNTATHFVIAGWTIILVMSVALGIIEITRKMEKSVEKLQDNEMYAMPKRAQTKQAEEPLLKDSKTKKKSVSVATVQPEINAVNDDNEKSKDNVAINTMKCCKLMSFSDQNLPVAYTFFALSLALITLAWILTVIPNITTLAPEFLFGVGKLFSIHAIVWLIK